MSRRRNAPFGARMLAFGCLLVVLLASGVALAGGRVQWAKTTVKENTDSKSWKIELKIFMSKAPDVPHVPMKFEFAPIAYYERAMMDGDKLVERRVPLEGRQDLIESVDVGFLDPASGKIEKGTQFSFKITRALGFDAGEYKASVRDARNGQLVGTPVTLKLEGENDIIDRRAMVFADPKEKKKKDEKKDGDMTDVKKDDAEKSDDKPADDSAEKSEDKSDEPAEKSEDKSDEKPGEIKKKPGGCGCRMADTRDDTWSGIVLALGVAALGARRSKRAA